MDKAGSEGKGKVFQSVLLFICIAGTAALAIYLFMFSGYYAGNSNKLVLADIKYRAAGGRELKPILIEAYTKAESMKAYFEWGGCRFENIDRIAGTFFLHCWGLARDPLAFERDMKLQETRDRTMLGKAEALPPGALQIVSIKSIPLSRQNRMLTLLAAYTYEKLHFDITSQPAQQEIPK